MFEISLNALGVDAEVPTTEQQDAGAPPMVQVQVVGGSALPLGDPQNPGRPMMFPSAAVSFALNRDAALGFAKLLTEKAEALPEERPTAGHIVTAQSMAEATQVAAAHDRLTKR